MSPQREYGKRPPAEAGDEPALALELLTYAATELPSNPANRVVSPLDEADDRQIQWVIDAGLGPLLYRATRDSADRVPAAWRDALLSAHLTAQVRHGNLIDAATEIIDACEDMRTRVTLLKGISISEQHYPAAHLRPMGDIDILVPRHAFESVESAILCRGYSRKSDHHLGEEDPYHGAPLFHPERRVWVEVHTALFPQGTSLRRNGVFSPPHVTAQSVASTFHGRPVNRLTDELQLAYVASFWIRDLSLYKIHPSCLPPLLDAVYLLKAPRRTLDWDGLLGWLDNEMAIASLYVMLVYLSRCGLAQITPRVLSRLASSQNIVGAAEFRIIQAMLDTYLIEGKPFTRIFSDWNAMIVWNTLLAPGSHAAKLLALPWNLVFPPPVPGRYSVRYQLGRITRLLRGRG